MTYMVTITITGLKHNPDMLTMFQTLDLENALLHFFNDDEDEGPEFDYDWEEEE